MAPVTTPTPAPIAAPRPAPLPPPIIPPMIAPAIPPCTPRSITCAEAAFGAVTWPIANAAANIAPSPVARMALLFMLVSSRLGKLVASAPPRPPSGATHRHCATSNCEPQRQADRRSWQGIGAALFQRVMAARDRRPSRDGQIPALHIGIVGEVHRLPGETRDPGPDGDVGDRVLARHILRFAEAPVEHPPQPP